MERQMPVAGIEAASEGGAATKRTAPTNAIATEARSGTRRLFRPSMIDIRYPRTRTSLRNPSHPRNPTRMVRNGSGEGSGDKEMLMGYPNGLFGWADVAVPDTDQAGTFLSLIHISEPTRRTPISYAVFCL